MMHRVLFLLLMIAAAHGEGVNPADFGVGPSPNNATAATGGNYSRTLSDHFADAVNVKDFGAIGDGVTDDQAAFAAAVSYGTTYGRTIFVPAGRYLVGTGNISVATCEIVGVGGNEGVTPYGQVGSVIVTTQTTNPVFLLDRGGRIRGLTFYYPNQDGSTITDVSGYPTIVGAPITYPATIQTAAGHGVSACEISRCRFINAYDCISLGDGTNSLGRVTLSDIEAYPVHRFLRMRNGTGLVTLDRFFVSIAVFQSVALAGNQNLGKWSQYNSEFISLENSSSGINVCNGIAYGFRIGVHFADGTISNSSFDAVHFDSTPRCIVQDGSAAVNNVIFANCTYYAQDRYSAAEDLPAIDLSSTAATGFLSFNENTIEYAQGHALSVTNDPLRKLAWIGGKLKNWRQGSAVVARRAGISIADANVSVVADGAFFEDATGSTDGVAASAFANLKLSACDFLSVAKPVSITGGTALQLLGCDSRSTSSTVSVAVSGVTGDVIDRGCSWDKPATADYTTHPYVLATTATAQAFTAEATVQFGTEVTDNSASYDPSTYIFTAPRTGYYDVGVSVTHDSTITANETWLLTVKTTARNYLLYYLPCAAHLNTVAFHEPVFMAKGDTCFSTIQRATGAGTFTLNTNANTNRFTVRYIE